MKPKKTLSNWLTTRYQLIIRNEENFAEKTSLGFTYSKVILFSVILFTGLFVMSLFLSKTILAKWFDPKHEQMVLNQQLLDLGNKVDSLAIEIEQKEQFIANFQRVLSGDTSNFKDPAEALKGEGQTLSKPANLNATASDSSFRKEFEKSDLSLITLTNVKYRDLQETFFYSPLSGFVSDPYDVTKGHMGVDIVAKANEPVKCIADGTVIFSSWTQDSGYVIMIQHRGNLISSYKHNAQLMKKVGTFVNGGEIVSIVGNSGELTNGPHLHFELWYNGNSLNPEEFVTF
ncbi:M23 family metallopeptidase [Ohtaekwangia koreensis]|uniref:Peptidase family M23 n=1 Tax=Ohtaekwangia koreensis TaxID=688867 RepID=A0A1T5LKC1_9BACT|nr:M23 family metallopeptidase [Ohtaekwangia koreensis]SKC76420.1 Peptidase family M23 [Ohtaekwangia koreensis]